MNNSRYDEARPMTLESGQVIHPKIVTRQVGNTIFKEAHYIDGISGQFIRKIQLETTSLQQHAKKAVKPE